MENTHTHKYSYKTYKSIYKQGEEEKKIEKNKRIHRQINIDMYTHIYTITQQAKHTHTHTQRGRKT